MQKNSWDSEQFSSMQFSLNIQSEYIDFDEIVQELKFDNALILKRGEIVSKVIKPRENDIYIYKEKYDNMELFYERFSLFLKHLICRKDILREYKEKYEVSLRIYIQSSNAQIYFKLNNEIINMLCDINIPVEFSVLSWGEVE